MADHDVEALLHEDLDLDYEVDEELQEDDLLGDNDDFILSADDTYQQEEETNVTLTEEPHTSVAEQEEDVLDLDVTEDATIEELEEETFNQGEESDSPEGNKERERFRRERPNTSGHTPIVFGENASEQDESQNQNKFMKYRGVGGRMRGMRGRGGMTGYNRAFNARGNFHNDQNPGRGGKLIHSRLGHRVPDTQYAPNPNLHIVSQMEPKKVLINPHFRGNVQPTHDARLIWDSQPQQQFQNQQQPVYPPQTFQNVGNFSQPIMQHHPHHHQPLQQQQPVWNNPVQEQQYMPQQLDYNQGPMPIQAEMYPQQIPFEHHQGQNNQLGPMFVGNQPQMVMNQQPAFGHRMPNRAMPPRFQQPPVLRQISTNPIYGNQNLNYPNVRPQIRQQHFDNQYQQPSNQNYQYQPYPQQVQFVQPPFQQFTPQNPQPQNKFNRVVRNIQRSPQNQYHVNNRSPQKRSPATPLHDNELAKKKKVLEFRNLQEVPRVDVPDTTVFFEDRSPMKVIEVEEEDDETKAYRLKIEEQRKLRELVLKQKEERRKRAAMEQQQAEAAQGLQSVNPVVTVVTTTSAIGEKKPVQNKLPVQKTQPAIKPLMQQRIQKPKQVPERVLVPVANAQPKNRVILRNQPAKKTPNTQPRQNVIKQTQVMPNTVSSTQQPLLLTAKRVVRAIPRQPPQTVSSVEATSSSATDITSESGDEVLDKEHLSQFLSTRTVVPKNVSGAVAPGSQIVTSSNVIVNGAIGSMPALSKTNVIKISNLSASTNELKIRKLCKGVGIIQNIQMSPNLGQAVIRFKSIGHAHNFYKKYQRKMVDLSLIDVKLVPPP